MLSRSLQGLCLAVAEKKSLYLGKIRYSTQKCPHRGPCSKLYSACHPVIILHRMVGPFVPCVYYGRVVTSRGDGRRRGAMKWRMNYKFVKICSAAVVQPTFCRQNDTN